eukprot:TRINITY_DN14236_c0_g1_i2.p1 TRINITY_DN14236_c0_g1~~TRINITY_DN14236_c0_g1_i2.p1  ORF type:complete len:293 (-),score=38.33 TRINITY_DN14236_c0_g1_i2:318-1196(-)
MAWLCGPCGKNDRQGSPEKPAKSSKEKPRKVKVREEEEDLIIEPTGKHTHTVILLHGLYCRGSDFEQVPSLLVQLFGERAETSGIKYIFPNAPIRTISWPDGPEEGVPSWYNYFTCKCGEESDDEIDMEHWNEMTEKMQNLIKAEVNELGNASKIIIGGNSQGGTIACNVALTSEYELGALFILRSCLLSYTPVLKDRNALPVHIFRAELDTTFIHALTQKRFQQFIDNGFRVTEWVEKDLGHEDDSLCELLYCAKWIGQVYFGWDAEITHRDRPDGPAAEEEEEEQVKTTE